MLLICVCTNVT